MAKGISLHIGLNSVDPTHYDGWSGPLLACESDAQDMTAIARSRDLRASMLLTREATQRAVTEAIAGAAAELTAGDLFVLSYSGHGGQLPDQNGDEIDDNEDETWCLYDGQLIDDELHMLFARFAAGVRIFVLSDSCHSGTVTKAMRDRIVADSAEKRLFDARTGEVVLPIFRGMRSEVAQRTYLANRSMYDTRLAAADPGARKKVVATVRLLSACQDDQVALDGTFNGLFTGKLRRVWRQGAFKGTYADFHATIRAGMPATQVPNHVVYGAPNPAFDAQAPFQI
jgi:metacaspase-1